MTAVVDEKAVAGAAARRTRRGPAVLRQPGLALSLFVLLLVLLWAVRPAWFAGHGPFEADPVHRLLPPGGDHWFGTDHLGRDVFARVVYGTSASLRAALLAVAVGLLAGTVLGAVAGTVGGWLDGAVMRCVDVLLALPGLLLSLAVVSALGFGTVQVAVAVGVSGVAGIARVSRAEVLRVRSADYVAAARLAGVRPGAVLLRHILPNSAAPVLVLAALEFGTSVLNVAALDFLGFGAPPPQPEWGALIAAGRDYLATAWWLTTLPGLVLAGVILAANRAGRALEREDRDDHGDR
ncbi:ABC transporter permease [Streptomyces sp. VRA16 Mangrove soil]|uniref:ABC transporter permease n=1 Tax=Streptomyces sp. VRA16 Mangrove soil TaxID=2817434 RepID=UPI0027DC2C0D|nr:ABC transporter permease [Streptomyces sp. VRA16 Mangrove soil]